MSDDSSLILSSRNQASDSSGSAPARDKYRIERFMKDVKNSLLFRSDWSDLLSAGPLSISKMGGCCVAANASNYAVSLEDAIPGSDRGLRYGTLKANIAQATDNGLEAFERAEKNMSMISDKCLALSEIVDDIIEYIDMLPDPVAVRSLKLRLDLFKRSAKECDVLAIETRDTFESWGGLVRELRQVILHKHEMGGETDRGAGVYVIPADSIPVLPDLVRPAADLMSRMYLADKSDILWKEVAQIDSCLRRYYKLASDGRAPVDVDWDFTASPTGQLYVADLILKLTGYNTALASSQAAGTAGIRTHLTNATTHATYIKNGSYRSASSTGFGAAALTYWAPVRFLVPVAAYHLGISHPVNTWDPTDPMDNRYYVKQPIPAILPGMAVPGITIPGTIMPGTFLPTTGWGAISLEKCAEALGEVSDEITKLVRFFTTISSLGQHVVNVHVRSFGVAASNVFKQGEETSLTQKERQDLKNSALMVQVYYSLIQSIAIMHVDIHQNYVARGLRLLGELSKTSTSDGLDRKNKSLKAYVKDVEYGLSAYMKKKKVEVFAKAEQNVRDIACGNKQPQDDDDGW